VSVLIYIYLFLGVCPLEGLKKFIETKIINEQFYKLVTNRGIVSSTLTWLCFEIFKNHKWKEIKKDLDERHFHLALFCWNRQIKTEWETLYFSRLNVRLYYRGKKQALYLFGRLDLKRENEQNCGTKKYVEDGGSCFWRLSQMSSLPVAKPNFVFLKIVAFKMAQDINNVQWTEAQLIAAFKVNFL
jgi:hypothetical protein